MQDESRSLGDVAIDMDSQTNPLQLQLIDEQVDCWCMFVKVRQVERNVCVSFDSTKTGKDNGYCSFFMLSVEIDLNLW